MMQQGAFTQRRTEEAGLRHLDRTWGTMERLAKDESVSTCGAPVHVSDWPKIGQREENSLLNSLLLVHHKAIGQG